MAINEYKVTQAEIEEHGIQGVVGDRLNLSVADAKKRFDELPELIANKLNGVVDETQLLVTSNITVVTESQAAVNANYESRISSIENRIDGDTFSAAVDASSPVDVTVGDPSDINEGQIPFGDLMSTLSANSNYANASIDSIESEIETLKAGDVFIPIPSKNLNEIVTDGKYRSAADTYANAPNIFGTTKQPFYLKVETDNGVIRQTVITNTRFTNGAVTVPKQECYRFSSNGGASWSPWENIKKFRINSGTSATPSYIIIGDIAVCMGYVVFENMKKNKQINKTVTFPVTFKSDPHVNICFGYSPETLCICSANGVTSSKFIISVYSNTATNRAVRWFAIGRIS